MSSLEGFVQRILDAVQTFTTPDEYEAVLRNLAGAYEVVYLEYATKFPERAKELTVENGVDDGPTRES